MTARALPAAPRRRVGLPRRLLACLAIPCSVCGAPASALAQHIDQYLNPETPGFDVQPGVTVASRLHPDYDYLGIRVGSFLVQPEITESVGYDDNIIGSPHAVGSAVVENQALIAVDSDWGRNSLGANLTLDNTLYPGHGNQNFTNWQAQLGGTYEIGRDTLYAGFSHLNLNQTQQDLDVPQLSAPIAYRVEDGRLNYRSSFSRLAITPGVDVSYYNFDNGIVGGVPYQQSYRNRIVVQPNLLATYELAPRRNLVFVINDANASYAHPFPGQPGRNFNDYTIEAGINYDVDPLVQLRILAGYEARDFSSRQYSTISAPIVEATVTWTPTGLTTLNASAARYIEDAASEATTGYTESVVKLSIDHEYLRNVLLRADVGFYNDAYPGSGGHQNFIAAGGGVTWLLNHSMRLIARYDFSTRQSNGTGTLGAGLSSFGVLGGNFTDNRFVLQLKFGF